LNDINDIAQHNLRSQVHNDFIWILVNIVFFINDMLYIYRPK